jgi:hypothetical protein
MQRSLWWSLRELLAAGMDWQLKLATRMPSPDSR